MHSNVDSALHSSQLVEKFEQCVSQVAACVSALENGVATVITHGYNPNAIASVVAGKRIGTMFTKSSHYEGPLIEDVAAKCWFFGK